MSWNNITPWWLIKLAPIINKFEAGELSSIGADMALDELKEELGSDMPEVVYNKWHRTFMHE